jgi:hypothetical protein
MVVMVIPNYQLLDAKCVKRLVAQILIDLSKWRSKDKRMLSEGNTQSIESKTSTGDKLLTTRELLETMHALLHKEPGTQLKRPNKENSVMN